MLQARKRRPFEAQGTQTAALQTTLLLSSLVCRNYYCFTTRLPSMCWARLLGSAFGTGRLRLGRRLLLAWRGRVRLLALLFRLLRRG